MGENDKASDDYQRALASGIWDRELQDSIRTSLDEVRQLMSGR